MSSSPQSQELGEYPHVLDALRVKSLCRIIADVCQAFTGPPASLPSWQMAWLTSFPPALPFLPSFKACWDSLCFDSPQPAPAVLTKAEVPPAGEGAGVDFCAGGHGPAPASGNIVKLTE